MNVLAEISMYPLREDHIPPIDDFLAALAAEGAVEVKTNRMSTQLYGEHDAVFDLLKEAVRQSKERHGSAAFVCKFLPGAVRSINGYE